MKLAAQYEHVKFITLYEINCFVVFCNQFHGEVFTLKDIPVLERGGF